MSSALAGIRVLDLTNVLAGPFCAYQLALLGADVVKIEVPDGGDLARQLGADPALNARHMGASFLAQNAGKKSVTLNLKKAEGKDVLRRLVESADVLVENFRPGVMARLGLAYEDLAAINPRLVYCAISGFGQDGPMKAAPAYDQIIQGLSGMMSVTGTPESAPLRSGYPVADTLAGMTAAFAISSALVRRNATGEGAFIDVSMLDAALTAMGWAVSNYLIAGVEPQPHGNDNFTAAPSGAFRAKDGLINIAANKQEQFEALVARRRSPRARDRPALRAAREPQAPSRRADRRARGGAQESLVRGVAVGLQQDRRSGRLRADRAAGAGAAAGRAARAAQDLRRRSRRRPDDHRRALRLQALRRRSRRRRRRRPSSAATPTRSSRAAGYSAAEIAALREAGIV